MADNGNRREVNEKMKNIERPPSTTFGIGRGLTGSTDAESSGRTLVEQIAIKAAGLSMSEIRSKEAESDLPDDTSKSLRSILKKTKLEDKQEVSADSGTGTFQTASEEAESKSHLDPGVSSGDTNQKEKRGVIFDEKKDKTEKYDDKGYDRTTSTYDPKTIQKRKKDAFMKAYGNIKKLQGKLEDRLGADKFTELTGITSENIKNLRIRINDTINLYNSAIQEEQINRRRISTGQPVQVEQSKSWESYKHLGTFMDIVEDAEDMEKKLKEFESALKQSEQQESHGDKQQT